METFFHSTRKHFFSDSRVLFAGVAVCAIIVTGGIYLSGSSSGGSGGMRASIAEISTVSSSEAGGIRKITCNMKQSAQVIEPGATVNIKWNFSKIAGTQAATADIYGSNGTLIGGRKTIDSIDVGPEEDTEYRMFAKIGRNQYLCTEKILIKVAVRESSVSPLCGLFEGNQQMPIGRGFTQQDAACMGYCNSIQITNFQAGNYYCKNGESIIGSVQPYPTQSPSPTGFTPPPLCPMDVKQCPNGSYVSRIAPNCDFAQCSPTPTFSPPPPPLCPMDVKQCPNGSYVSRIVPNCDFAQCSTNSPTPTPDATFTPTPTPFIIANPAIKITYPTGGETLTWANVVGREITTIRWQESYGNAPLVDIDLLSASNDTVIETIARNVPNQSVAVAYADGTTSASGSRYLGSFVWKTGGQALNGKYRIRVIGKNNDGSAFGNPSFPEKAVSNSFLVRPLYLPPLPPTPTPIIENPQMRVTYPVGGETFDWTNIVGEEITTIRWEEAFGHAPLLDIELLDASKNVVIKTIAKNIPNLTLGCVYNDALANMYSGGICANTGSFVWKTDRQALEGKYRIRITGKNTDGSNFGNPASPMVSTSSVFSMNAIYVGGVITPTPAAETPVPRLRLKPLPVR